MGGSFVGTSMDSDNKRINLEDIYALLDKAKKENKSMILYGHSIEKESKNHHTSPERLEKVLKYGTEIGISFKAFN